jgi:hypothetical protein
VRRFGTPARILLIAFWHAAATLMRVPFLFILMRLTGVINYWREALILNGNYAWQIITSTEWVDGETATSRLAAETKMDHDAFIVAVTDAKARNPFDAL